MKIEEKIVRKLEKLKYHISFAESMTGGLLASTIVNVSGASNVLEKSFVTYSNRAKIEILNVQEETIKKCDVVSCEVAEEMAKGLFEITKSDICVSVTGYAEGYMEGQGKVCYAIYNNGKMFFKEVMILGNRNMVRKKACTIILNEVYRLIKGV